MIIDRKCNGCHKTKPLEEFVRAKSKPQGYGHECKVCSRDRLKRRKDKMKSSGLCVDCGQPTSGGKVLCLECSKKQSKRSGRLHRTYIASGKCRRCLVPLTEGHTLCDKCLQEARKFSHSASEAFSYRVGDYFCNVCSICALKSENHEIFDCHHVDPSKKDYNISKMVYKEWGSVVVPELEKCVYICSNCHRQLHAGRFDQDIASGKLELFPGRAGGEEAA